MSDGSVSGFIKKVLFGGAVGGSAGCNKKAAAQKSKKSAPRAKAPASPKVSAAPKPVPAPTSKALITCTPTLVQEMNSHDSKNWQKASWSNGNPFNNTWQPDNVSFKDGKMVLTLDNKGCPSGCDGKPYASGEYRTAREMYRYGLYEARIKPAKGAGLVGGSFFTYTGIYGQPSHDEIDIEFLGKDCSRVQLNYYSKGKGKHEKIVNLGFNACSAFHNYGFKWSSKEIVWYVDGKPVHRATGNLPSRASKIMVNLWPGTPAVNGWLGSFIYSSPLRAEYDWIRHAPLNCSSK